MAPHSSTLAWKIPWMEEPGRLQSMGSRRVGQDWATSLSLFTFMHWRRKWQSIPVFLPGESQGRGAWWAALYGVAQSRIWLKCLSSSSRSRKGREKNYSGLASGCPRGLWYSWKLEVNGQELYFQYYQKNKGVYCWNLVIWIYLYLRIVQKYGKKESRSLL